MEENLQVPPHPDVARAVVVLELRVAPLDGAPLAVADLLRGGEGRGLPAAGVPVDQRDMPEALRELPYLLAVVRRVGKVVEAGDALRRHLHEGDGRLAVMQRRGGHHGHDRHAAVRDREVELVAQPVVRLPLAVAPPAPVASPGKVSKILRKSTLRLELDALRRVVGNGRCRCLLRLAGASAFPFGRGLRGLAPAGALAPVDLRGVVARVPDDLVPVVLGDHRLVQALAKTRLRELAERAAERGAGRDLAREVPAAQTVQPRGRAQVLDEQVRRREVVHGLEQERAQKPLAASPGAAENAPEQRVRDEPAGLQKLDEHHELPHFCCQFADFLLHRWKKEHLHVKVKLL